MDESKPDQSLDKGTRALNVLEGGNEKTVAVHSGKHPNHNKETHGMSDDIDVSTPLSDVKGPNVLERVKEEFEAIVETIHTNKEDKHKDSTSSVKRGDATLSGSKHENQGLPADKGVKAPHELNGQEESKALLLTEKQPTHSKETHGLRDDIDVNTPISDIKGPNVFERVLEEFEAIVDTIHPRKDSPHKDSPSSAKRNDTAFTVSKHDNPGSPAGSPGTPSKENSEAKEETHKAKSPVIHHKETHGRGQEIDPNTPISEFRGPSIFHRAKEEFEAIVDTIHSKKESEPASPKKEGGFRATVSKKLHRIYTKTKNRD